LLWETGAKLDTCNGNCVPRTNNFSLYLSIGLLNINSYVWSDRTVVIHDVCNGDNKYKSPFLHFNYLFPPCPLYRTHIWSNGGSFSWKYEKVRSAFSNFIGVIQIVTHIP